MGESAYAGVKAAASITPVTFFQKIDNFTDGKNIDARGNPSTIEEVCPHTCARFAKKIVRARRIGRAIGYIIPLARLSFSLYPPPLPFSFYFILLNYPRSFPCALALSLSLARRDRRHVAAKCADILIHRCMYACAFTYA